jgi:cell division protein FtsZ
MSRQEEVAPAHTYERPQPQAAPVMPQAAASAQGHRGQPNAVHAEYAKRAAAAAPRAPQIPLDQHGRAAPQSRTAEEDHLEIPAFLRRQSN